MNTYSEEEIEKALRAAGFSKIEANHKKSIGATWLMLLAEK